MGKFIIISFVVLGFVFYEMSGGADFEPIERVAKAKAADETPAVTRNQTASLIQIAAEPAPAVAPAPTPVVTQDPTPVVTPDPTPVVAEIAPQPAPEPDLDLRAVAGDWVNMRAGPSTDYSVLDTLPRGTKAEVIEISTDGWARIRVMTTGQIGWMAERLLNDA